MLCCTAAAAYPDRICPRSRTHPAICSHAARARTAQSEEWTNLSIACARGDAPLVRLLLEAGATPNDNDSLYHSVEPTDPGCLRLLLTHGATVGGTSTLHHALDFDRLEPVRLLLENGGDPTSRATGPRSITRSCADARRRSSSCSSNTAPIHERATATAGPRISTQSGVDATTSPRRSRSSGRRRAPTQLIGRSTRSPSAETSLPASWTRMQPTS